MKGGHITFHTCSRLTARRCAQEAARRSFLHPLRHQSPCTDHWINSEEVRAVDISTLRTVLFIIYIQLCSWFLFRKGGGRRGYRNVCDPNITINCIHLWCLWSIGWWSHAKSPTLASLPIKFGSQCQLRLNVRDLSPERLLISLCRLTRRAMHSLPTGIRSPLVDREHVAVYVPSATSNNYSHKRNNNLC